MRGKKHKPEIKAAVMAALLTGQGVAAVASQYKLDKSVVSRWRAQINSDELQQVATKKGDEFAELLADALRSILKSLKVSADAIRSTEGWAWVRQNSPAEFATLIGVLTDKGFRLLEAAEYSSDTGSPAPDKLEPSSGSTD
jgi:transposase-like protein